jgi:hypothetical protein
VELAESGRRYWLKRFTKGPDDGQWYFHIWCASRSKARYCTVQYEYGGLNATRGKPVTILPYLASRSPFL